MSAIELQTKQDKNVEKLETIPKKLATANSHRKIVVPFTLSYAPQKPTDKDSTPYFSQNIETLLYLG